MTTSRTRPVTFRTTVRSVPRTGEPELGPRPFDGYPYLATRIGRTALRHLAVVPADWPRERLVALACRQAEANRLETCLVLGPADTVFVVPGEEPQLAIHVPTGIPVIDRLAIAGPLPDTAELRARRAGLWRYAASNRGSGYLVGDGLEDGRRATVADIARLTGPAVHGLPPALHRCATCGEARGDFLAVKGEGNGDPTPRVIDIGCACDNDNHCAGCGEPLNARRLSAYHWVDERVEVVYVAAYIGLGHRCAFV
jgi:hypothetical protein